MTKLYNDPARFTEDMLIGFLERDELISYGCEIILINFLMTITVYKNKLSRTINHLEL